MVGVPYEYLIFEGGKKRSMVLKACWQDFHLLLHLFVSYT